MNKPVLHPQSQDHLASVLKDMPQSLLIAGQPGIGLKTIGQFIASSLGILPLIILPEKNDKIDEDSGVVGVDTIRRLYTDTRTKTQAGSEHLVIIHQADRMTRQAQNAFLKLLEEPNTYTRFVLTSNHPSELLPTVMSRLQKVIIRPITTKQSNQLLDTLGLKDEVKRRQLLFAAEGLPAELTRLANDEDYFNNRADVIRDARTILQDKPYQRLMIIQKYKDDRHAALSLLSDTETLLYKGMVEKPSKDMLKRISSVLKARQRLEGNGNIRLALLEAFI